MGVCKIAGWWDLAQIKGHDPRDLTNVVVFLEIS